MSKRAVLMEMAGLTEGRDWGVVHADLTKQATKIGQRYVKTWQKGTGKDDPALPAVLKDLRKLLKDAQPAVKRHNKGSTVDIVAMTKRNIDWLKKIKPAEMDAYEFNAIGKIIDDLKMWFG